MPATDMNKIMRNLKIRREALGLSFQDLSDRTGMSKSTLQRYETGGIRNIPLSKVHVLADALDTTPEYILGWEEEKPPVDDEELPQEYKDTMESIRKLTPDQLKGLRMFVDSMLGKDSD